jgi:hypothetical protein
MTASDLDFTATFRTGAAIADELAEAEVAYAADTTQHHTEIVDGVRTLIIPHSMIQQGPDGDMHVVLPSPVSQDEDEAAEAELLADANRHIAAAGSDHWYGPWFPGPTGQQQSGYLSAQVGLENGRLGLLIDTGAFGNLQGDEFAHRATAKAAQYGLATEISTLQDTVTVNGVGNGSQCTTKLTSIPVALTDKQTGGTSAARYSAPTIANSGLPPLWGLKSMKEHRVWLDLINNVMYMVGPGDMVVQPPPGTRVLQLEQGKSGHLFLPASNYKDLPHTQSQHTEMVLTDALSTQGGTTNGGYSFPPLPPQVQGPDGAITSHTTQALRGPGSGYAQPTTANGGHATQSPSASSEDWSFEPPQTRPRLAGSNNNEDA